MSKIVRQEYITGEKGVSSFNSYCTNHEPFLVFREEAKHDFGIDGEIELTRLTQDNKTEVTGKILKIQLKSTKKGSYIANENDTSFEFIAKLNDLEYWREHEVPVVIVIYFENSGQLFAKKVNKQETLNKKKKSHRIIFDKVVNLLTNEKTFTEVIGQEFVERVEFEEERLFSNLMRVKVPSTILCYKSKYKRVSKIFDLVNENGFDFPHFVLESDNFYTFSNCENVNSAIRDKIFKSIVPENIDLSDFILSRDNKRVIVRLINNYLKKVFYHKQIRFDKELSRYIFFASNDEPIEIKQKKEDKWVEVYRKKRYKGKTNYTTRTLVAKYVYVFSDSRTEFYRHLAFQLHYEWIEQELFLIFEPKYFFSEDGFSPLSNPKRITRLTNQLKSSEHNQTYINHLFFFRNFFDMNMEWKIEHFNSAISISRKYNYVVPFKIKGKNNKKIEPMNEDSSSQLTLDF